jgi:hypothetical protein
MNQENTHPNSNPDNDKDRDIQADERSREAFMRILGITSPAVVPGHPDEALEELFNQPSAEESEGEPEN